jgi:leader peptidase (prepilin peptidase)/N-methyltransferase
MIDASELIRITVFLYGLAIGSFLNVLIFRLPREQSLSGRSGCPHCGSRLGWVDLVPVLSFMFLRGRCRRCRAPISWRYPLVELATGLLALAIIARFGATWTGLLYFGFGAALIVVTFIDLDWKIIPDVITLPGVAIGLVAVIAVHLAARNGLATPALLVTPARALAGAIGGAGGLWLVAAGYRRATGVDGLGLGDVKLAALLGAFLGGGGVFLTVFIAAVAGSLVGMIMIAAGRGSGRTALPFGSFLAPAGLLVLFYGPTIIGWYLGRFRGGG